MSVVHKARGAVGAVKLSEYGERYWDRCKRVALLQDCFLLASSNPVGW